MFSQEFQAVVLAAGKGSRMPEITAGKPKCLLPVGSKPLVWYPLHKLQKLGFSDAILIVQEAQKAEIQSCLDKCGLSIKVDYVTINDDDLGTADSLRLIHDKLKSDVLILSCDLITDINLAEVVDLFRRHDASLCALFFNSHAESVAVPGPKAKHKPERDLVGVDAQTDRLVFLASASDFESTVSFPRLLLKKHSNLKMYSNLVDSHFYVLKNWIIKYLVDEESISTIKGELLPHIIRKQLLKPPTTTTEHNISMINAKDDNDIFQYSKDSELNLRIRETSTFNDHSGDFKPAYHGDSIRCFAYIAKSNVYGVRVNTLPAYCSINAKIVDKWENVSDGKELKRLDSKADIRSTQVDDKCIVWETSVLHEKTSYKNSIIGPNCEINNFSRVFNSVLMNNVTVKEKVALENCIVCDGAVIESGSQLKNCLIGSQHTVPEQSVHSNEVLTVTDRLMEF